MTVPCFFGYGSLVNRATHDYPSATLATAHGWRRSWVHTDTRPFAYLSAVRAPNAAIEGLIAEVPGADWQALDAREHAYERLDETHAIRHSRADVPAIAIYAVAPEASNGVTNQHPILLSYLDVVFQGYLQEFGEAGVAHFVDTTDGWDAPVLNDRARPRYPRHQDLTRDERACVDDALSDLKVRFQLD